MCTDMSQTSTESDFRFSAEISEPKKLIPMLKAIHIMKTTVMAITCRGLKLTCQDSSKSLQANSFIDRSLFITYNMSSEDNPVSVCFRLSDLLNVLTLLGMSHTSGGLLSDQTLEIRYSGHSDKLTLLLKEDSYETKARIKTYSAEDLMIFNMNSCNKVILNAEPIVEFWKSCDLNSDYIQVSVFGREPYLQWTTESERAKVNHNIHRDGQDVQQFMHSRDVSNRYKMSLMKTTLRALIHTTKLSIRTDEEGLLSLQFMIKLDQTEAENCFVEYFILPEAQHNFYQT